jgi:diaminohydroxyphosphoribosylaminopyrimidine deaminase/5-amino-6-(5-phosphoribosylamino)uracil reductase
MMMKQRYKENSHEYYMQRCIELAEKGLGTVAPNPLVGSVIVHNNQIIGEGYHQKFGDWHAEVNAINAVIDKTLFKESTIYVNLEPCAHFGKTPPCASLIASLQFKRVVIGQIDPFAEVAGKGIQILKNAGCEVETGILEKECRELNRRFLVYHEKKRPYIILKWAETLDSYVDKLRTKDTPREPFWITNKLARRLVHKWRTEEMAILVGTNTALKDNPALNVRNWSGKNPVRMVLDRSLRLPADLSLFDKQIPTIVFTEKSVANKSNISYVQLENNKNALTTIIEYAYNNSFQSIIVEGGTQLIGSFMEQDLWDEARVLVGNKLFGRGIEAPRMHYLPIADEWIGDSRLLYYRNRNAK